MQLAGVLGAIGVFESGESAWAPFAELRCRVGLGRDLDVGLGTAGYLDEDLYSFQADTNFAFARSGDVVWSVDPTIAFASVFDVSTTVFWLPVMVDVYSDEHATWTLSAKYGYLDLDGVPDDDAFEDYESGSYVGIGIGCRWRLWETVSLFPEFDVVVPYNDLTDAVPLYVFGVAFVQN